MRHDTNPVLHFNLNRHAMLAWLPSLLLQCASATALGQPADSQSLPRYLEARSSSFVDWLADGSMLVMTRFGETTQVHRVRSPLSMREQLSFESSGIIAAAAQPAHDDAFVTLSARNAGRTALVRYRPKDHALDTLTDGSKRDGAASWAHDGRRLVFSSDRSGGRHNAAAHQATAELFARPGHAAADRAMRPAELPGRLADRQTFEVAQHDRQTEPVRQSRDLAVQRLRMLAGHDRLVGRWDRRLGRRL